MAGLAGLGKALQAGAAGTAAYQQAKEDRQAFQRKAAEDKLATSRATEMNKPDVVQEEVAALRAQNKSLIGAQAKADSYKAFGSYQADSNVRHLNTALKNPAIKEAWGGVVSINKVDPTADTELLLKQGYDPGMFTDESVDKNALSHRLVKAMYPDGTSEIKDMQQLYVGSGYARSLDDSELENMLTRSQIQKNLRENQGVPSTAEKTSKYYAGQGAEGGSESSVAQKMFQKDIAGVTPGKLEIANQAEGTLEETFGGKFFETNFTDRTNRIKASKAIREIEQAGGEGLAAADKADVKDINVLIASGKAVAEELTPEATGILDNFTSNIEKYMEDEHVESTAGRAAYNAYRNALLRAFGGTAMSDAEVQNFNAAFGTLAQKYPAVISQFKQAITQTKAKLDTVAKLNNPYLAHYYLGTSQDDLDIILSRLDKNMEMIQRHGRVAPKEEQASQGEQAPQDWKKIWGKAK
jgi:hypothetical protein